MNTTIRILLSAVLLWGQALVANAKTEERNLPVFTEISLRVPAKLYLEQGETQKVTLEARSSTLEEIITEINNRALIIRFPAKKYLARNADPGEIIIHITLPEITALNISGSGDIIGEKPGSSMIMDLNVSGSGNILLNTLNTERLKANISGSGNITLDGGKPATELNAVVSGSGNLKAGNLEVQNIRISIAGSGNCYVRSNGHIDVKIAGSGDVYYSGNPSIDSTVAGSGSVNEIK